MVVPIMLPRATVRRFGGAPTTAAELAGLAAELVTGLSESTWWQRN
jgi:hypothetical protein